MTQHTKDLLAQKTTDVKFAGTYAEQVTIQLTMPVAKAEQVRWQGAGPCEPMGKMLREGSLDAKSLGWAIEHAYNPDVRAAARTLLIHFLGEPTTLRATLRYGPQVYGGSDYLEEKQYDSQFNAMWYAMGGVLLALGILYWLVSGTIEGLLKGNYWLTEFVAVLLLLLLTLVVLSPIIWWGRRRFLQEISNMRNYRAGREAEETVLEEFRAGLDNRWTIFRNLTLPGVKEDIDLILVGPAGVIVVEVKAYKSPVRISNGVWERQEKRNWRPIKSGPAAQSKYNAVRLRNHLETHGIILWVDRIIVLTEPQPVTNFANPEPPVWFHFDLATRISTLNDSSVAVKPKLDEAAIHRIVAALCEVVKDCSVSTRKNVPDPAK